MKDLNWFNKIMFFFNMVLTILTFFGYVLPFLAPKLFPLLSVLTLLLPTLLIFNVFFSIYWMIQLKRQFLLSSVLLLIGMPFISKFYKINEDQLPLSSTDFTIMSYNVRYFNLYEWLDHDVQSEMMALISEKKPDVLCIQEYCKKNKMDFSDYKYQYIFLTDNFMGQAIFSKYPIINKGDVDFPESSNNLIYADIVVKKDTLRIYSMHLQSVKISKDIHEEIDQKKSEKILKRISNAFSKQQYQSDLIKEHKKECKLPIVICGDMNNSAFSYVYRNIRGKLLDCFEEKGTGLGSTYPFKYYPARIDYIFANKKFKIKSFENFPGFVNSDHLPIMTRLSFPEE